MTLQTSPKLKQNIMIGTKHMTVHSSVLSNKYCRVNIANTTGQAIINPIGIAIMNKLEPIMIKMAFTHKLRANIPSKSS